MPKKKKPRGHPARHAQALSPTSQMSPLRAGGRVLGDLQIEFRRFLEAELEQDGPDEEVMPVEDVEARLMESLGWFALSFELDLVPATARRFAPADLAELFTEIVPSVAEHNELDPQELVDETRLAWTSYLMFLGESEQWAGEPEELADCLDVASGGVGGAASGQAGVLDALAEAEAKVPLADRYADLRALPVVQGFLAAFDELAAGVDLRGAELAESPAVDVVRGKLSDVHEVDPVALVLDLAANGSLTVDGDRTVIADADDLERRYQVATFALAAVVTGVLASTSSPAAIVGALTVVTSSVLQPMTSAELRGFLEDSGDAAEFEVTAGRVARLVELGVLSPVEPWTARPGFAGAVLDVVDGFFRPEEEPEQEVQQAPQEG
ncbi:hypothetical protein [Kineococcus rhizosphaerae]|uniref:Uncharacterized protein n=1 Tax=Kineococcus rhizosphaerae TaxID=559628 RepID=A0A2T0R372_9ACTN|nr:hypothetical protein [Kineococcus rhizosphaerae]PRY14485.1 hypothetical protein CLV37_10643 [Kineococcus rhizosphaerae]